MFPVFEFVLVFEAAAFVVGSGVKPGACAYGWLEGFECGFAGGYIGKEAFSAEDFGVEGGYIAKSAKFSLDSEIGLI